MPFKLWDRIRDWLVLCLLLAASVFLMLAHNEPMLRGLRAFALDTTSRVEARFAWVGHFFRALAENERLRRENIELASLVARSREARVENDRLRAMLAFRDSLDVPMVAARIVSKDLFLKENFLTLNVGRSDSVEPGMAVVDERGIIGKVVFVSDHYARVMSYLNTDFRVPAKVYPVQSTGIVRWPGTRRDRLLLEHVAKTEPIMRDQLVVTSSFSGVFPEGFPIGRIDSIATRRGRNELEIFLRPAAPLHTAEHAFVLLTRPDPERLELEARRLR